MEFVIRLLKLAFVCALMYAVYFFIIKDKQENKPEVYSIDPDTVERTIEAPASVAGKTFVSDEGITITLNSDKTCTVNELCEENEFSIKGTPQYSYKKKDNLHAVLKINFTTIREKGHEILENEYRYEYELKFTKPSGGRTHCNYMFMHKIGVGDRIKSYIEADTRPTWFELK